MCRPACLQDDSHTLGTSGNKTFLISLILDSCITNAMSNYNLPLTKGMFFLHNLTSVQLLRQLQFKPFLITIFSHSMLDQAFSGFPFSLEWHALYILFQK